MFEFNKMNLLILVAILFFNNFCVNALDNNSLVAVHLIFRHGDRCPEMNNLYKTSQYYNESYFKPYGFGQLTNKGKLTAYNLGKEMRTRYNGFLDDAYNIHLIEARSSDFNRTKASLQAALAGLFPPTEELSWLPGLNWQPIPITYVERNSDKELFCFACPTWDPTIDNYLASEEGKKKFEIYDPLLKTLTNETQQDYSDILNAYYLYFGFEILGELGYTLPSWANQVFPYPLKNLTMDYYDMITATSTLRQMAGGYLLKHILHDTQEKIDGKYPEKKMYLWCAHENNIASVLRTLNVWSKEDVATYGSYIALELHYFNETYGYQILYKNNASGPELLTLPQCDSFCPLETFKVLVQPDIPAGDGVCKGATSYAPKVLVNYIFIFIMPLYSILIL